MKHGENHRAYGAGRKPFYLYTSAIVSILSQRQATSPEGAALVLKAQRSFERVAPPKIASSSPRAPYRDTVDTSHLLTRRTLTRLDNAAPRHLTMGHQGPTLGPSGTGVCPDVKPS